MWFDGQRQPNTLYVANTSRGKDSTAMLRAIQLMGWPLDMICSVDIWFDESTPAELPPMVKFKDEYDRKVFEWFGVPVTRLCATKRSQICKVERERERAGIRRRLSLTKVVVLLIVLQPGAFRKIRMAHQRIPKRKPRMVQAAQGPARRQIQFQS